MLEAFGFIYPEGIRLMFAPSSLNFRSMES
jgi:hypothetical protein